MSERIFSKLGLARRYAVTYRASPSVKHLLLSVALLASLAATGCAASSAADDDGGPTNEDAGLKDAKGSDGNTNQDTGPSQCETIQCTSDQDCQNVCPPVTNGGANCCDTTTGICYAFASSTCPAPVADAGFD